LSSPFDPAVPATQALFQSGWFVEGLLTQTLIVHMIRTEKIPFIESTATLPLTLQVVACVSDCHSPRWLPRSGSKRSRQPTSCGSLRL
jgi:hypothetical protein